MTGRPPRSTHVLRKILKSISAANAPLPAGCYTAKDYGRVGAKKKTPPVQLVSVILSLVVLAVSWVLTRTVVRIGWRLAIPCLVLTASIFAALITLSELQDHPMSGIANATVTGLLACSVGLVLVEYFRARQVETWNKDLRRLSSGVSGEMATSKAGAVGRSPTLLRGRRID